MKTTLLTCLLVLVGLSITLAGTSDPSFTESFKTNGPVDLHLSTSGGGIEVKQGAQNAVVVEFYVRKSGKVQDMSLHELKKHKKVEIIQKGNEIVISVQNEFEMGSKYSVSFVAYAPQETSTKLSTSGGGLKINGFTGNQRLATSGGGITLNEIFGDVDAATSGGGIKGARLDGMISISTSGGSINLADVKGKLETTTSGGSINLERISGSVSAATSGGNIYTQMMSVEGNVELATSGGNIDADLPNDIGLKVDLRGDAVVLDFENFRGVTKKDHVSGVVNGGGHKVHCRTSGGSIKVF